MSTSPNLVTVHWSTVGVPRAAASLRGPDGKTIRPLTDYLDYVADELAKKRSPQALRSRMDACVYGLCAFANYLLKQTSGIDLASVDDSILKAFRDDELKNVRNNTRSREFKYSSQLTVNIKLRQVYDALAWLCNEGLVPADLIGPFDCRVESTAPAALEFGREEDRRVTNKYPLCFPEAAENSRERPFQHFATPTQLRKVEAHFWETSSTEVAVRNCMMLRILDIEGWRVASANSLYVSQFEDPELLSENPNIGDEPVRADDPRAVYMVSPPSQKYSYGRTFEMPWELAHAIRRFIDDKEFGRAAVLARLNLDEAATDGRVFISDTDGSPLASHRWSEIFSDAFRATGATKRKGAGGHSIRRGSGTRKAEEEVTYLKETNSPVTMEAVNKAVSEFLGQSDPASSRFYLLAQRRLRRGTLTDKLTAEIEKLKFANDKLRVENQRLSANALKLEAENEQLRNKGRSARQRLKAA